MTCTAFIKGQSVTAGVCQAEALIDGVHAEALYNLSGCLSRGKKKTQRKCLALPKKHAAWLNLAEPPKGINEITYLPKSTKVELF